MPNHGRLVYLIFTVFSAVSQQLSGSYPTRFGILAGSSRIVGGQQSDCWHMPLVDAKSIKVFTNSGKAQI